ncbi:DEAD/DEAH box helicase, partial [Tumebacillus sp. DT12]
MTGFQELGVISELSRVLTAHGIFEPTPVQSQAIPVVLAGDDVLAQAQTGTGKTLAFVLPMLQKIDPSRPVVQGLILCPTRELALQVSEEIKKLLVLLKGINVLAVYGGQDVERQMRKLQGGVHLIVATPGRLLDHLRRGTVDLWDVKMLVLDEADQMLHMGFLPEVEAILREVAEDRQTMLFSATMPEQIRKLANKYLRMPVDVKIEAERLTVKDVRQLVIETTDRLKQDTLKILIEEYRPFLAIIFCRTKRRAQVLNEALQQAGYESDELHGDLSQAKREQVMKKFREAKIQLLVATDVAARGLDVSGVTHVFNYDIPHDLESYVHRIGRTGRAGERGIAITLASSRDREFLAMIEQGIEMEIERHMVQGVKIHRAPLENYSKDKPYGERRGRGGNDRDRKGGGDRDRRGGNDRDQKGGYGARGGNDRDQKGGYGARGGNDRDQKGGYGARGGNDRDQKGGYGARGGNDRDQKGGYGARGGNDRDQKGGYGARGGNDRDQKGGYGARSGNDRDQRGGCG